MSDIILETKHLTFSYDGKKKAINDINVKIKSGERIAVLGANGAGKSTFFLHLNGVRCAKEGAVFLDDEKIDNKKKRRKLQQNVGIVFQDADSQIVASTVKSEVAFGPMNMDLTKEETEQYTMDAIKQMNLEQYVHRPPHYLSGGEKKRVGIADILAMKPRIIVFDEPTAMLDPVSAQMLEKTLKELKNQGKTIMLSTHDIDFAYRFAERVIVFCDGEIIADGEPEEIFSNEELLARTNLKKPVIMEVCNLLQKKGILQEGMMAKNLHELEDVLKISSI